MKKSILIMRMIGIIMFVLVALFYIFIISGAFAILMPEPPKPQIIYGEFPFCITYELDGETKKYEDTIVCEFIGIKSFGTGGKHRNWSYRLKSGNEYIVLFFKKQGDETLEVYCPDIGVPEYFMGDFRQSRNNYEKTMKDNRYLGIRRTTNGKVQDESITAEDAYEKYGLRILDIVWTPPVENTFS